MSKIRQKLAALESELSKYKEALSDKLTEDQGYCQEYTGIVILKEKLAAVEAREVKLVEALDVIGYTDRSRGYPTPHEWIQVVKIAKEALEENKKLRGINEQ